MAYQCGPWSESSPTSVESPLANRESFNSFECFLIGGLSRHPLIVCCVAVSLVVARYDSQQAIHSVQSFNQGSVFCEEELCRDWELLVLIICPPLDNVLWHCYRYCFVICNESQLIENITFCADDDTSRAEARTTSQQASQHAVEEDQRNLLCSFPLLAKCEICGGGGLHNNCIITADGRWTDDDVWKSVECVYLCGMYCETTQRPR